MGQFRSSQETVDKINFFCDADREYKEALEVFERAHEFELANLDKLRETRNVKLDEAKRAIKAETELTDAMRLTYDTGPFKVQKKWSDYYIPEKLVAMLTDRGLYDSAVTAGIVAVKVETAKYVEVKKFLETHGLDKQFECCEDGKPDSIAVGGPKQVPPLGAELKKE